jgi:hypothetical protein
MTACTRQIFATPSDRETRHGHFRPNRFAKPNKKGPRNDYAMNWPGLTIKDGKAAFHRIPLAA